MEGKLVGVVTVGIVDDLGSDVSGANVSMIFFWYKEGKKKSKPFSCTDRKSVV